MYRITLMLDREQIKSGTNSREQLDYLPRKASDKIYSKPASKVVKSHLPVIEYHQTVGVNKGRPKVEDYVTEKEYIGKNIQLKGIFAIV